MKKFFIVLSALAALMLCVVPAQALVGSPDDVPGCDAIVPFVADISGSTGLNTLIILMDASGGWTETAAAVYADRLAANFHYSVNTTTSVTVFDGYQTGTTDDVVSTDAFTILAAMSSTARTALEVDIDGDGTNDHYAGYIYYQNVQRTVNSTVGQFYFVNLAAGKAAAANIPMKEYSDLLIGTGSVFWSKMVSNSGDDDGMELFSPNALVNAIELQAGNTAVVGSNNMYLYPRIFIVEGGVNWLLFWQSANAAHGGNVHSFVYNADEVPLSTNVPLDQEFHVYDASRYLPTGLWTAYPHEGFIRLSYATTTAALQELEIIGWVYQQATGTASESWTVMTPMWRDAD